ncbi:hypothetical protein FE257_004343 [Aspergillus nanangensis]|uniref:GED domain-containing protein n=1 Tax=Aspergillus nanangensis TaxID=2582783 RepID=A0AAD4GP58_ASPNN|nr:hypothetical protein FE257_004343 [Aspergillus nanangensis]
MACTTPKPEDDKCHPTPRLQSDAIKYRLNQIDQVRAQGIGDCISLPQLVVCGDQSSGKSSVLTGVTGFPWSQHDETASSLRSFRRTLNSTGELPSVVQEAATLLGIRGYSNCEEAPAFAADVLRVEIVGDTGVCLTIVDLPGLISVSDYDEEEDDLQLVNDLVDKYLMNTRSIILAVVQASNDIQNQRIIQRARAYDKGGERTIGVVTKPDLVNRGTEHRIARLANNLESTRLNLGFFIIKNPSPEHLERGISMHVWKQNELAFFHTAPWKDLGLNYDRVGIDCLRSFLETTLEKHIEQEIPKVCDEVQALLDKTRTSIFELGDERSSVADQRKYLLKASMDYVSLMRAALDGRYQEVEPYFFGNAPSQPFSNRLRAHIHDLNTEFAAYMRDMGQKRKISCENGGDATDNCGNGFASLPQPVWVSQKRFYSWVEQAYKNTRGLELPGSHNHVFLSELFHEQSSRWPAIASQHLRQVHHEAASFARRALTFIIKDKHINSEILKIINPTLEETFRAAQEELRRICDDEKIQPVTYNHYYTDTIQKARSSKTMGLVRKILSDALPVQNGHGQKKGAPNVQEILATFDQHIIPDMDQAACEEATEALNAYYKVSMKTFVDNVCRQVLERHVVGHLHLVFDPTRVGALSDERVRKVALESPQTTAKREELKSLAEALENSLRLLSDDSDF